MNLADALRLGLELISRGVTISQQVASAQAAGQTKLAPEVWAGLMNDYMTAHTALVMAVANAPGPVADTPKAV